MPIQFKNPPHDLPDEPLFVYVGSVCTKKGYAEETMSYAVIVNGDMWRDSQLIAERGEWKVVRSLKMPFNPPTATQETLF